MDDLEFIARVASAISNRDKKELESCVDEFAEYCFEEQAPSEKELSQAVFDFIVGRMRDESFQLMDGSWFLLRLVQTDFGRLTNGQKAALLVCFRETYAKFRDFMSCFLISEILGKYYSDANAVELLEDLSRVGADAPRALVPMGLGYVARSADGDVSSRAIDCLRRMRLDESAEVRAEVELALRKLRTRGIFTDGE